MVRREKAIPPDSLDEILTWLNPDREIAAEAYLQLRADLSRLFNCRLCADPEGLTDEVFDRVARKVHAVKPTYVGDPRHYFLAVAKNVVKEEHKQLGAVVSLSFDPLAPEQEDHKQAIDREECLQTCLQRLPRNKRDMIVTYYLKPDQREELARQVSASIITLRVRVHRLRAKIRKCMLRCLFLRRHNGR